MVHAVIRMTRRKIQVWSAALLVVLMSKVTLVEAPAQNLKQIIVKCSAEDLDQIRAEVVAAVVDAGHGHFVLAVASTTATDQIESVHGKGPILASENLPISIRRQLHVAAGGRPANARPSSLGPIIDWYGTPARQGYTNQPANAKIRLNEALAAASTAGAGVRVAVIDTGIDENHPTLKSVTLPGRNYIGRTSIPSEWDDPTVSQSHSSFVDQSQFSFTDKLRASFVDMSAYSFVDLAQYIFVDVLKLPAEPAAFGHGTMMAGLVHLVAPKAGIIPLKAFDATGAGSDWNVVRAIYDAVDLGADIINMSFSSTHKSKIMESDIQFAARFGLVLVG